MGSAGGNTFHKLCFKCSGCKVTLNVTTFKAHEGSVYCAQCVPKASATAVADDFKVKTALNAPKRVAEGLSESKKDLVTKLLVLVLTLLLSLPLSMLQRRRLKVYNKSKRDLVTKLLVLVLTPSLSLPLSMLQRRRQKVYNKSKRDLVTKLLVLVLTLLPSPMLLTLQKLRLKVLEAFTKEIPALLHN